MTSNAASATRVWPLACEAAFSVGVPTPEDVSFPSERETACEITHAGNSKQYF
jgi:hypothetical protein